MNSEERILEFLSQQKDITLGYSDFRFVPADSLEKFQVGYSFDPKGNSLMTGQPGAWQPNWIVIASDELGDPYFVDTDTPGLCVLTAAHGMRHWDAEQIADSLESFAGILDHFRRLAQGRVTSVELDDNPLTPKEARDFLTFVGATNPNTDIAYWEGQMLLLLDNDTE